MPLGRTTTRVAISFASAAAFVFAFAGSPADARADGPVSVTGKGAVGLGLLGGEVVCISMGAAGVNTGWPYLVFGSLAAAGGAVGGYFAERKFTSTPEVPMYALAAGLALFIPSLVVSLNATAYRPPDTDRTDTPSNEPVKDAPKPSASRKRPVESARVAAIPASLVGLHQGQLAVTLPAPELRPLYSSSEMWRFGVSQGTELKLPLFQATF